jgi:hypothetical protein
MQPKSSFGQQQASSTTTSTATNSSGATQKRPHKQTGPEIENRPALASPAGTLASGAASAASPAAATTSAAAAAAAAEATSRPGLAETTQSGLSSFGAPQAAQTPQRTTTATTAATSNATRAGQTTIGANDDRASGHVGLTSSAANRRQKPEEAKLDDDTISDRRRPIEVRQVSSSSDERPAEREPHAGRDHNEQRHDPLQAAKTNCGRSFSSSSNSDSSGGGCGAGSNSGRASLVRIESADRQSRAASTSRGRQINEDASEGPPAAAAAAATTTTTSTATTNTTAAASQTTAVVVVGQQQQQQSTWRPASGREQLPFSSEDTRLPEQTLVDILSFESLSAVLNAIANHAASVLSSSDACHRAAVV